MIAIRLVKNCSIAPKIIKLLWKRGFELFPNFRRRKEPFASYLFFVTQGPEEILPTGRKIADRRY